MLNRDFERFAIFLVPIPSPHRRTKQAAFVVEQHHHRTLDSHRVRQRSQNTVADFAKRQHRNHGFGNFADGRAVAGMVAIKNAVD